METRVTDRTGASGTMEPAVHAKPNVVTIQLPSGARVQATAGKLLPQSDGTYRFDGVFTELPVVGQSMAGETGSERAEEEIIPIVEETARIEKRVRETGRVRITKQVREHQETIDEPLFREDVDVRRVPVDRVLERPVEIRQEGDTLIIPILEERAVVQKQLVLKEELHVTRRRTERREPQEVTLRTEAVDVERIAPETRDSA